MSRLLACGLTVAWLVPGVLADSTANPGVGLLEDFNEGVPATWSVVDNLGVSSLFVWTTNDVANRPNYAGGDGLCADADSDEYGTNDIPYDTSLITPLVVVPANAELHFDAAYNDHTPGGSDLARVSLSSDGGGAWVTLLEWDEDHSPAGPGEHLAFDLGAYEGQGVLVEFRYLGGGWEWYFEIDNVAIIPEPAAALLLLSSLLVRRR